MSFCAINQDSKAKAAAEGAAFLANLTANASGAAAASAEQLPPPGSHTPRGTAGPATAAPTCSRWQADLSGMLPPSVKEEPEKGGHSLKPSPGPLPPEPFTTGGFVAPQQHCVSHQSYAGLGRRSEPVPGRCLDWRAAHQEPERSWSVRPQKGPGPCSSALEPWQPFSTGRGPDDSGNMLLRIHVHDYLPDLLR